MQQLRQREERGHTRVDWLDSYHTFSFGDYHDPRYMGFGALRVINDDRISPGKGFGSHGHRDMEIITYILEGVLEHKDSMGNGSLIYPGDVQRMTAGTGVTHSEFNPSNTTLVHLLQIWILPEKENLKPAYEQQSFPPDRRRNQLCLIASRDGRNDSVTVHQDVSVYAALLNTGSEVVYPLGQTRMAWVHVAKGTIHVNGTCMEAGDGMGITDNGLITFLSQQDDSECLLFDLAKQ